jgi:anthranilate 1,2-dioxygenase large subunit
MEDGAAPGFVQRAAVAAPELLSVVEMGGSGIGSSESKVSEAAVRGMWHAWREQMGI